MCRLWRRSRLRMVGVTTRDIYALMSDASRPFVTWVVSLVDRLFAVEARSEELAARVKALEHALDELDRRAWREPKNGRP